MHIITSEEEKAYFTRAAKHRSLHDLGRLIVNQGMRPDEALSLAKSDVYLERGQVQIQKGKSPAARRALDLTHDSRVILARRLAGSSPWIFPGRLPGEHMGRLNGAHDRLCQKAGEDGIMLNFVLYDFRHTFATRMAQAGDDLATLAAILGHNSIRIVQKYVHPTSEHKRAATALYDQTQKDLAKKQAEEAERRAN